MMEFSTDQQLLALLQEVTDFRDSSYFSGSENWQIRIREESDRCAQLIQSLHEAAGEPAITFEFLESIAGLQTGAGYLQGALQNFDDSNEREGRNQSWQSLSYITFGIARVKLAIDTEDESLSRF